MEIGKEIIEKPLKMLFKFVLCFNSLLDVYMTFKDTTELNPSKVQMHLNERLMECSLLDVETHTHISECVESSLSDSRKTHVLYVYVCLCLFS